MAETSAQVSAATDSSTKQNPLAVQQPAGDVEMENLSTVPPQPVSDQSTSAPAQAEQTSESAAPTVATTDGADDASPASTQPKAPATAGDTDLAINPVDPTDPATSGDLAVDIMLVLVSNGNRHPFRIDEKYLTKRNVTITGNSEDGRPDPSSITVYTLKELILREWRPDWDQPPREPTAIRLVYFGKLLEDRMALSQQRFKMSVTNVVHMTVKPQDIIDEEEATKRVKDSAPEGTARSGCCVIL
ncbi:Ubiquitin-2 like Rad60 SUMO-like [Microdochium nivale]|nr:Ubiquitin-2 like Rad60 SUMO-like [Microdochium nivale]